MFLPVNPAKLVLMAWPLLVLVALSVWLRPHDWTHLTFTTGLIAATPFLLFAMGVLGRGRWGLEITPEALIQRGFGPSVRYEWARMGPVNTGWIDVMHVPLVRTVQFLHPIEGPKTLAQQVTSRFGRRIPAIYGDRSAHETAELIESWRRLYVHDV